VLFHRFGRYRLPGLVNDELWRWPPSIGGVISRNSMIRDQKSRKHRKSRPACREVLWRFLSGVGGAGCPGWWIKTPGGGRTQIKRSIPARSKMVKKWSFLEEKETSRKEPSTF
jgi:hypothetical protein